MPQKPETPEEKAYNQVAQQWFKDNFDKNHEAPFNSAEDTALKQFVTPPQQSEPEVLRVGEDMICPVTHEHCWDECCTVGAECNVSGNRLQPTEPQEQQSAEEIAQWVIDNRYSKGEFQTVSDFEIFHTVSDRIKAYARKCVEATLKKAADRAKVKKITGNGKASYMGSGKDETVVDKESITSTPIVLL